MKREQHNSAIPWTQHSLSPTHPHTHTHTLYTLHTHSLTQEQQKMRKKDNNTHTNKIEEKFIAKHKQHTSVL